MSTSNGPFTRWFLYPREPARLDEAPSAAEYARMSVVELRARARVLGIRGFARLPRPELIAALLQQA